MITKIGDKYFEEVDVEKFKAETLERISDLENNLIPFNEGVRDESNKKIDEYKEELEKLKEQLNNINKNEQNNGGK